MITFLVGAAVYGLTGYLMYLKWIRMSPPQEGTFEHANNSGSALEGWYVPALIKSKTKWEHPRGMRLEAVMWMSITGWPIVLVWGGCLLAGGQIKLLSSFLARRGMALSHSLARTTFPPEKPKELPKSPELIEAEAEVEKMFLPEEIE